MDSIEKGPIEGFFVECGMRASRMVLGVIDRGGERDVDFELSSWNPTKGDTLAIVVRVPPPSDLFQKLNLSLREIVWGNSFVSVTYGGSEIPAYPITEEKSIWRALAPSTPLDVPGPRSLAVDVRDGRHKLYRGNIQIVDKDYPVESIWLSDTNSSSHGFSTGTRKEKAAMEVLRLSKTPVQHWSGPFKLPAQGDVTTGFGLQRFYNGVFAENYYHQGIDYGAEEGTPVKAPAKGRVVLVGKEADGFQLHGNCIGLDHGHGVTSILMHLSSVDAVEGEIVKQGDTIGAVGESGLATGPHLHWGLLVNGKAVDPNQWLAKQWWL
ncbi:hypothetical protein SELMODRAFT_408308 [Selaginella moellendorffii]|uniref:M23ase beta-sheet core domain-containing protein n=1 Tax=Selaginella moellendorffii TaxID=88036 RepID=D8R7V8_SELML|nr:hypothetical protein SELMODRAFT_408308 [Selaginella moellendorffii]